MLKSVLCWRVKGDVVNQTIVIMQQIETSVTTSNQRIAELNLAGEEVEKITDVIAGVAEQTNLLALNAAIEAARAESRAEDLPWLLTRSAILPVELASPQKRLLKLSSKFAA
nr:methyl-accepting chemotaxis protein [Agarivorans gilvus]